MFVLSVKDFRKWPGCPLPDITEEAVAEALVEAGIEFNTPMALRLRIKDRDARMLHAKAESVDEWGDEFRLNVYLPVLVYPDEEYLGELNAAIRHMLAHIAQGRAARFDSENAEFDDLPRMEAEAEAFAQSGTSRIIDLPPVPQTT